MTTHCNWLTKKLANTQASIVINRIWLDIADGDYNLAVFISQFIFQASGHSALGEDRFYKTDDEFAEEIGLNRQKVMRLKDKLLNHPVIGHCFTKKITKINGTPVTHYHVNMNKLSNAMRTHFSAQKTNSKPPEAAPPLDCPKTNNGLSENEHSDCPKSDSPSYTDLNSRSKQRLLPQEKICGAEIEGVLVCHEEELFNQLWAIWPLHRDRETALVKFKVLLKNKTKYEQTAFSQMLYDDILLRTRGNQYAFKKTYMLTYLNKKRWNDEPPKVNPLTGISEE